MERSIPILTSILHHTILFLILFVFAIPVHAEDKEDFIFVLDKSIQKMYENPEECITYTQGFLINEHRPEYRIILQNSIAQAYALKGDYVQSIRMSLDNEKLENDSERLTRFSQLFLDYALSEQYQNLGLYHQSEKLINRIINQNEIQSKDFIEQVTLAKVYQLHGINLGVLKKYNESNEIFDYVNQNLLKYTHENEILKFENKVFISGNYIQLKNIEKAKTILLELVNELNQFPHAKFLHALVKERLSRIYFIEGRYDESLTLLNEALIVIASSEYLYLKSKIHQGFSKNYLAKGDFKNYQLHQKQFETLDQILINNSKEGIRYLLKLTESNELKNKSFVQQKYSRYKWIAVSSVLLLNVLLFLIFIHYFNRKKDLKKQLDFFSKQNEYFRLKTSEMDLDLLPIESKKEKNKVIISKETEKELLQKLKTFEKSDRYLNKDMSLALLAGQLETNTKYLSEVINTYKGKNFSAYINELRVNHIAYLLKTEPAYLNYKVSYLAEVAGFTSHSTFTTVFKSVTGISPNTYIQQLTKTISK